MAKPNYEQIDTRLQGFPFESPHFPAFFRLLRWKLLDVCVESTRSGGLGHFELFRSLFPVGELEELVYGLKDETMPVDPYQEKLDRAEIDDKMRRQAESYIKFRVKHQFRLRRRRYVEYFFTKVLFNEQGLRIADKIMYNYNSAIYDQIHLLQLPSDWVAAETFRAKFFKEEELENDPYAQQLLDRAAGSSRGNLFKHAMDGNQRCEREVEAINAQLADEQYAIQSKIVQEVLDEGPIYMLERDQNGDEQRGPLVTWTEHKTRLIFLAFPMFEVNEKVEKNEHEDWYYALLSAMSGDPYNRAALFFLNRNYEEEIEEINKARKRRTYADMKSRDTGEEMVAEIRTEIRPQPIDSGYQADVEVADLQLRNYQTELVQPALEGKNCVIVAPTGSGKTEVAIYAALSHIKDRENAMPKPKPARVVMLVPKIPLVGQQQERFLKYCRGKYKVDGFHGSEKSSDGKGRMDDVLAAHVIIMTPQILLNMWQSVRQSERLFVSDFTMVIFDEVHKASGNHPYVEIANAIEEWPHEKPQIIGLTASLNVSIVGNSAANDRMFDSIYEMLAILNAPALSAITKQENIDELNEHVGKPDDSVEICQKPPEEHDVVRGFIQRNYRIYHAKFMAELETLQKIRPNCYAPGNFLNLRKAKIEYYEQYEAYLQNMIYDLNRLNMPEKGIALMYAKYLKIYVEARGIIEIMPSSTAYEYLEEALEKIDSGHSLSQFHDFAKDKDTLKMSVRMETDKNYPDIVKKLLGTLKGQFEMDSNSRVIIFVTQRSTAKRVCDFLNKSRIMDEFYRSGDDRDAVGYVLGTNKQGAVQQSQQEQTTNIEKFNNGRLKIMVATSVVEEGLDVAACNLIVKYNCSSGSAIQLVQQRGRARAKNSRSVLLSVSNVINEKENQALISEKYMKRCVSVIMKFTNQELVDHVARLKKKLLMDRERLAREREMLKSKLEDRLYHIKCASCTRTFCSSIDIKKMYSNYLVFNPEIWDQLMVQANTKKNKYMSEETQPLSEVTCIKCGTVCGKAYKIRGVYLPMLLLKQITFTADTASRNEAQETKVKWSQVEEDLFYVAAPLQKDFENMLHALSTTGDNLLKKKVLDYDSKQHIADIERFRFDRARKQQEEQRKQKAALPKNMIPSRKFSDDEEEKHKEDE